MANSSSSISSEFDLKAHIASYPELYEDLAVDVLEERLEMWCWVDHCLTDDCTINICGVDDDNGGCGIDLCWTDT